MARQHSNKEVYNLIVDCPNGIIEEWEDLKNLKEIADLINTQYFNDFPVVNRAIVNNWILKPALKRPYAERFKINTKKTVYRYIKREKKENKVKVTNTGFLYDSD